MIDDESYRVDIDSLHRAFPPGTEVPQLLLDFAAWLRGRPWGCVGCFDLVGTFPDRAPIVDGSPLRHALALFMSLPEGSKVGAWFDARRDSLQTPIVVLGSEGQNEILAPSLESFLAKIALSQFEDSWSDFLPHEDAEDATRKFEQWIRKRLNVKSLSDIADETVELPDFGGWIAEWCRGREQFWSTHPILGDISIHLTPYRPEGKQPWDRTHFEVAIVGRQFQVRVLRGGRQPVDEASAIEPLLRRLRDETWHGLPQLGLWYSAAFTLDARGCMLPSFDYETRPQIDEAPADLGEAIADLERAPRPERWVPVWLATARRGSKS